MPDGVRGMEGIYWAYGKAPIILDQGSPGYIQGGAVAVNNAGVIAGALNYYATEWSTNGSITWQSPDSDGNPSQVMRLNASGTGLGFDGSNAAEWSSTGKETLFANAPGESGSWANAINASGQAAGYAGWTNGITSSRAGSLSHEAVKWSPTGAVTVLSTPVGDSSEAISINKAGDAVGYVENSADVTTAMGWGHRGNAVNFNTMLDPAWTDTIASGINNAVDIVGTGKYNGVMEAFELIPVKAAGAMDFDPLCRIPPQRPGGLGRPYAL